MSRTCSQRGNRASKHIKMSSIYVKGASQPGPLHDAGGAGWRRGTCLSRDQWDAGKACGHGKDSGMLDANSSRRSVAVRGGFVEPCALCPDHEVTHG